MASAACWLAAAAALWCGHLHFEYACTIQPWDLLQPSTRTGAVAFASARSVTSSRRRLHVLASKKHALAMTAFCITVEINHGPHTGHGVAP